MTVVEAAPRLLPRLGHEVGAHLTALHREDGARVHLGSGVAGVRGDDAVSELVLADGTRIATDHVVEAVGVRPATAWFAGAELDEHVFTAGDVTGSGHWDAAARQGAGVARALLGLAARAAGPGRRSGATSSACACSASATRPAPARSSPSTRRAAASRPSTAARAASAPCCSPAAPPPTSAPPAGA